ncbi:hypothetical protein B0H14DRAFT_2698834 [Mycena olivaceomarginata]|nr:hypothetical protein B0H14DRAFT_2698834 [Mycena olivaceomarginata]
MRKTCGWTIRVFMCRSCTRSRIGPSRSQPFHLPPRRRHSTYRTHRFRLLAPALPRPLACCPWHTDNAFPPPSSGPPFLVRTPTARAFPIAPAPKVKNKSSLPLPLLILLVLNSKPRTELCCTPCTPTHCLAHSFLYHSNFHCHSFMSLLNGLSSLAFSLLVILPMLPRGYLIIAYFTLVIVILS